MHVSVDHRVAGRFKVERIKAGTGEVVQSLEFKNLITDLGLNALGTTPTSGFTYVSTNSTAPSVLDTTLPGFLAATSTVSATTGANTNVSPYWVEQSTTRRFAAGAAAGNLTKVGIGWTPNSVDGLWSSALIVDGSGNPTTITVLPDEFLDVTYTLRYYPPLTDSSYTVTINGTAHTISARVSSVTTRRVDIAQYFMKLQSSALSLYSGAGIALGPVTGVPTGAASSTSGGAVSLVAYVNNSLQRTGSVSLGLSSGNLAGGITGMRLSMPSSSALACDTQMVISPAIPKDDTKTLTLTFSVSWSRYP